MTQERIREVFSDEKFVEEFFSKDTPEEAKELLEEKDIDVSVEDLIKLREMLIEKIESGNLDDAEAENEEIDDTDLEDVSGGSVIAGILLVVLATATIAAGVYRGVQEQRKRNW